jgi:hypothetical protein
MNNAHAPRPTDLVALVSFDGEVYENQAVTRDRLGKAPASPHPLIATIQRWLGGERHVWIDVRGRQIHGIATARQLATPEAWEIDTLVDAGTPEDGVVTALLGQACEAAVEAGVTHLSLRLQSEAPALPEAVRAGFVRAVQEELWAAAPDGADDTAATPPDLLVRDAEDEDAFALFQLYNRAWPINARQALAVTFEEWQAVQERRWIGRGGLELVACDGAGRLRGTLQASSAGQFTLLVDPDVGAAGDALYAAALEHFEEAERPLALQPACLGTPTSCLRARGYEPADSYIRLSRRMAIPLLDTMSAVAGRTVPTRG